MKRTICLSLLLTGCIGLGARESSVMAPNGEIYRVRCQSDGLVKYRNGDVEIHVDNRGPAGQVWAVGATSLGKVYDKVKGEEVLK